MNAALDIIGRAMATCGLIACFDCHALHRHTCISAFCCNPYPGYKFIQNETKCRFSCFAVVKQLSAKLISK